MGVRRLLKPRTSLSIARLHLLITILAANHPQQSPVGPEGPESDDFTVSGDFTVMKALAFYKKDNNCCMDGKTRCTGWQNYSFVCLDAYTHTVE
eukprot:g321.t1